MGQSPASVQIWTVPWVCSANRDLPQPGRYPLSGPVLAGAPPATLELGDEAWHEFVARALAAVGLREQADEFALIDTQACYVELGPRAATRARDSCTVFGLSSSMLRVRTKEIGGGRRAFNGRVLPTLSVELVSVTGVSRILAVPRCELDGNGEALFMWVKAFAPASRVPELRLVGAVMIPMDAPLGVAAAAGLRKMRDYANIDGWLGTLCDTALQWWKEDVSLRSVDCLDIGMRTRSLGLRSGYVVIAHPDNSQVPCDQLYMCALNQGRSTYTPPRSEPPVAPGQSSQSLPTRIFTPSADDAEAKCQICLELFMPNDVLATTPCLHTFHSTCVDEWLARNSSCPVCRHSAWQDS